MKIRRQTFKKRILGQDLSVRSFFIFVFSFLVSCQLVDTRVGGSFEGGSAEPPFVSRLNFTGDSLSTSSIATRTFDENTLDPVWTLTGECDVSMGDVTVSGDIDADVNVTCDDSGGGTFSLNINYDTISPYFRSIAVEGYSKQIYIQQGNTIKNTWVYKINSVNPPTIITTALQLQNITVEDSSAHYILGNDIDIAAEFGATDNWDPIGDHTVSDEFRGELDGNGYTISNLHITNFTINVGLFDAIANAKITNLNLTNVYLENLGGNTGGLAGESIGGYYIKNVHVQGEVHGSGSVGLLVGSSLVDVYNSSSSGVVTGTNNSVGGLLGSHGDFLENSYSTANVTSTGLNRVGGLVGQYSDDDDELVGCYATGDVTAINATSVGGLVGHNNGIKGVRDSYATGNVIGNDLVGGLVGNINGSNDFTNSYSTGDVTATVAGGRFVGETGANSISNSYFSTESNCTNCSVPDGEGKTLSQLKQQSTFIGWDFTNIWTIDESNSTPQLIEQGP